MSGDTEKRSDLIDITYAVVYANLASLQDDVRPEQLKDTIRARKTQIYTIVDPFGKPSSASKKIIESGSVKLADGVTMRVENADKEYIFAISELYQIDEVQAFILFRAYLFDQGLPDKPATPKDVADQLAVFFSNECLFTLRCLIPLFRKKEEPGHIMHDVATELLPEIIPDGPEFAERLIAAYVKKTTEKLPEKYNEDPKKATAWAKHNLCEQLVMLEVLFWTMWGYVSCSGPLVEKVYDAAYRTNLGALQAHNTLLLDEQSKQLQDDCAALWMVIMVEILELETLGVPANVEISDAPERTDVYYTSPASLKRIHDTVMSRLDSQFACTFLGWTYVLSRLQAKADEMQEIPTAWKEFFDHVNTPSIGRSKERQPLYMQMATTCVSPEAGLFQLMQNLLTGSPLFVSTIALKKGSAIADPNAVAFRSVMKGLLMTVVELVPVEMIPDFDGLVEVWVSLFGRSESATVSGICAQFWKLDFHLGYSRRAIFDAARTRFPIQVRPLLRLLRAMTGAGFLDTDPLYTSVDNSDDWTNDDRKSCESMVFQYFSRLPSYSQLIPLAATTGGQALYERQVERFVSGRNARNGPTYTNLRPLRLPGGSILPPKSVGAVLSADPTDTVAVSWTHEHSGWKVVLEILTDYVNRRRKDFAGGGGHQDVSFARRSGGQIKTLSLEDVGVERDAEGDETIITDALDLVRSVIQHNPSQAVLLMQSFEEGNAVISHKMTETAPPDLVQLTTMILEEALSRTNGRVITESRSKLITSSMRVLSALLAIPEYANRVWLYIRSTTSLFGTDRTSGFASVALAAERATGRYTMTLALLQLVSGLFHEATASILPENEKLQELKEEVLLRATRFIHTEIWVEHMSWKYLQLGDRFDIGKLVVTIYANILDGSPPTIPDRPFALLSQTIAEVLLYRASTSTINPLVSAISSSGQLTEMLTVSQRHSDIRRLVRYLASTLRLCRIILTTKSFSEMANRPCLLEQTLCARVTGGVPSLDSKFARCDPIDALAGYMTNQHVGNAVPIEATRVMCALATSLPQSQTSPPTIISHLSKPEVTVSSLIRIVSHPYDELALRKSIWNFISIAVDLEPALAALLVTGKSRSPLDLRNIKGKAKEDASAVPITRKISALEAARDVLANWKDLWDANPLLLSCIFRFLHTVWQHALEHKSVVDPLRKDGTFWERIVAVACEEVGPVPAYETEEIQMADNVPRSAYHEAVQMHAYRNLVKSFAVGILTRDIGLHIQLHGREVPLKKPESYAKLEPRLKDHDQLNDLLSEAAPSSYSPELYDKMTNILSQHFKGLSLDQVRLQAPVLERDYGDTFAFSTPLFCVRLAAYSASTDEMEDPRERAEKLLLSINLNLSLVHAEGTLIESWEHLLKQVIPYLRTDAAVRPSILSIAATLSFDIAKEQRHGEMMASIHNARLSLILALLEVAWFSPSDKKEEVASFMELVQNLRRIVTNEAQSPARSILGTLPAPFHRTLLQIIFFCVKHARSILVRPKVVNAEQRLDIAQTVDVVLDFVIDALRVVFEAARTRADLDLDRDMELLVAVFEQCIRREIDASSIHWLTRCQETDVIKASLQLFSNIDLVGVKDLSLLVSRKRPLYSPHILLFHMALVSNPAGAERFASDGVLSTYSNNMISSAGSAGMIDVVLPELPGQRSPAHVAYCSMISIIAMVLTSLGRQNHYFDAEACGFVRLYGEQIARALSWTINEPVTLPLLEEIDQVINLFYAIAASVPTSASAKSDPIVSRILRIFSTSALQLLQQVNYAITHPNQLASMWEPVTPEERARLEKAQAEPDPMKQPHVVYLIHRLFQLSANIVGTLVTISRADLVLSREVADWPIAEALVIPHSKIVLGEPASLGTLVELGNRTLDILRNLVQRPAGQKIADVSSLTGGPALALSVKEGVVVARRNLEEVLLYAVTQLAMWLSKPELDHGVGAEDAEDSGMEEAGGPGGGVGASLGASVAGGGLDARRGTGRGMTMAERLRRGMTGEMTADLQALLTKSKTVIASSDAIIGKPSVDLTQVLLNFLHERINGSS